MKTSFNSKKYFLENPDLSVQFGTSDDPEIESHYRSYGHKELRGISEPRLYMNIEGIVCSDQGHVLITGWCDQRALEGIHLRIDIGYMSHDFGKVDPCWYRRDDVSNVLTDYSRPNSFILVVKIPEGAFLMASDVTVYFGGFKLLENQTFRFCSVERYMDELLGKIAVLADMPVGKTMDNAHKLQGPVGDLWKHYLNNLKFFKIFENRPLQDCKTSIVITLHQKFDMLLVQLSELASYLVQGTAEIIVVGNDMHNPDGLQARVTAFCQIHDIAIRLYLCSGNSGFSAANNFGASEARGETLVFMNPDIFPPEGDREQALAFLDSDPGDELQGALLYYGDGMLMHSGMYAVRDLAFDAKTGSTHDVLRVEHFGKGLSHRVDDDNDSLEAALREVRGDIMMVSAALWKISRTRFEALGGLSTDYIFAYYEDADFALRFLQSGGKITLDRTSRWIHMEGVGRAKLPAVRSFMWLNRARFSETFQDSPLVVDTAEDLKLL